MSKKRGVWILLVIVFLSLSAHAASAGYSKEVFTGNVFSGTSIDIDGDYSVIVTHNKLGNRIFVDAGDDYSSVNIDECEELKNIRVCFTNMTYDTDELKTFATIKINKTEPTIAVTRTITSTDFYAGEEQNVTVQVKNTGDTATDGTYYEDWGDKYEIVDRLDGPCSVERSAIIWKGSLEKDETLSCEFTIKAIDKVNRGVVGSFKYFDGFNYETEYGTELVVDVKNVVDLKSRMIHQDTEPEEDSFSFETDHVTLSEGEEGRLAINITNMMSQGDYVDVILRLHLPKGVMYTGPGTIITKKKANSTGNFTIFTKTKVVASDKMTIVNERVLEWHGRLKTNATDRSSKVFILDLLPKYTGISNILVEAEYTDDEGRSYDHTEYIPLSVASRGINTLLYINDPVRKQVWTEHYEHEDSIDIVSLHKYALKIQVQNENAYANIKDVEVRVVTNLTGFDDQNYALMSSRAINVPFDFIFKAPRVEQDTDYDMSVYTDYTTENGEKFSNMTKFTINVKGFEGITINHEFEKTSLEGDEESSVTVSLTNNLLIDIPNVRIKELIDPRFKVKGVLKKNLVLKADEDIDVLSYVLTAPRLSDEESLKINTTVEYPYQGNDTWITKSDINTMAVKPKELDLSLANTLADTSTSAGSIEYVEYTITNSEDEETIKDILLTFPLHWGVDLIGERTYKIEKLRAGESVKLLNNERIRIKTNGTVNIGETEVVYHDVYGTVMEKNASLISMDVKGGVSLHGPAILVNRTVPAKMYANDPTKIVFRVRNIGDEGTTVNINEAGETYTLDVPGNSERLVEYMMKEESAGKKTFSPAVVTYKYLGETYTTISDPSSTRIEQKPIMFVPAEEPKGEEMKPEEVPVEQKVEEAEAEGRVSQKFILQALLVLLIIIIVIAYLVYRFKGEPTPPILEG